jgi:lipopolysaccharide export LptBFGC system permease protein LptF
VFALIGLYSLVGGNFNRKGYGGRIALACVAVLAARLPGFGFQLLTNNTPDAAIGMYIWPALWIGALMFVLSVPRFELLKAPRPRPFEEPAAT